MSNPSFVHGGTMDTDAIAQAVRRAKPEDIPSIAYDATAAIRDTRQSPVPLVDRILEVLQRAESVDQQAILLSFIFLIEKKGALSEQTASFLEELATTHGHTDGFSEPFKRFIDIRLRIVAGEPMPYNVGDLTGTKETVALLRANADFFHDILELQSHFSATVSPIMPLNSTWNPLLVQTYNLRGARGLWFVYANNKREDYVAMMKQQMNSEWTGFNRFVEEPWDKIGQYVNKDGNIVDIGSSIGIAAIEIARALDMRGAVVLLDIQNPLRNATSLRIVDYANPNGRLIPLSEATKQMAELLGNLELISLFNVDISRPLSQNVETAAGNAAFVHFANVLPYLHPDALYQSVINSLTLTNTESGILRFHNDYYLPIDSVISSITLRKKRRQVEVLEDLTRLRR